MRGSFIDMRVEGGIKGRVESWEKKRMHESGGERQDGKAVGSNGSSIEASAPTFGGQGLDKLSRPYGKLRVKWDGQESRLRIVFGEKSGPFLALALAFPPCEWWAPPTGYWVWCYGAPP